MQWTDKAAERLICKNVPIDNLHCKSGLPVKSADLCSDIVSKLVKVTIGNMFVITSGSKVVKERTNGNKILRSVELV